MIHVHFSFSTALLAGAAVGLGNSLGSVGVGQPTTPSINTTSQIDPSSIERAYAALGLTYQGNQMQPQPAMQNQQSSQSSQGHQSLRSMNAMGRYRQATRKIPLIVEDNLFIGCYLQFSRHFILYIHTELVLKYW